MMNIKTKNIKMHTRFSDSYQHHDAFVQRADGLQRFFAVCHRIFPLQAVLNKSPGRDFFSLGVQDETASDLIFNS